MPHSFYENEKRKSGNLHRLPLDDHRFAWSSWEHEKRGMMGKEDWKGRESRQRHGKKRESGNEIGHNDEVVGKSRATCLDSCASSAFMMQTWRRSQPSERSVQDGCDRSERISGIIAGRDSLLFPSSCWRMHTNVTCIQIAVNLPMRDCAWQHSASAAMSVSRRPRFGKGTWNKMVSGGKGSGCGRELITDDCNLRSLSSSQPSSELVRGRGKRNRFFSSSHQDA